MSRRRLTADVVLLYPRTWSDGPWTCFDAEFPNQPRPGPPGAPVFGPGGQPGRISPMPYPGPPRSPGLMSPPLPNQNVPQRSLSPMQGPPRQGFNPPNGPIQPMGGRPPQPTNPGQRSFTSPPPQFQQGHPQHAQAPFVNGQMGQGGPPVHEMGNMRIASPQPPYPQVDTIFSWDLSLGGFSIHPVPYSNLEIPQNSKRLANQVLRNRNVHLVHTTKTKRMSPFLPAILVRLISIKTSLSSSNSSSHKVRRLDPVPSSSNPSNLSHLADLRIRTPMPLLLDPLRRHTTENSTTIPSLFRTRRGCRVRLDNDYRDFATRSIRTRFLRPSRFRNKISRSGTRTSS